jgi:serine/threonine-protein kinase
MDEITSMALAKDLEQRFASAAEFLEAMRSPVGVGAAADEDEDVELEPAAAASQAPAHEGMQPEPIAAQATATATMAVPPDPNRWWTFYQGTTLVASARFAKVYRGIHRQTGETHAIKHLQTVRPLDVSGPDQTPSNMDAARRLFLTEMHILQALSEETEPVPGIVRMVQAYRGDERNLAYAMPFLPETLGQRVERTGAMPARAALAAAVGIADALAALHERQVVHRGVNANSVMFSDDDEVVLGGFDRACRLSDRGPMLLLERELHSSAASPLHVLGDVRFLSPEQCRGEDFDQRTDTYALGCLLYFMLAGEGPFSRTDPMQTMMDHVSSEVPRLRDAGVDMPGDVQNIIDRALAKSPHDRYASITEMREAIALQIG